MSWLLRDGAVLAAVEVADSARARRRGLLGRDGIDGAIVLAPCRQVHTARMRFPIDVAFCDREGLVLYTATLSPWRLSRPVWRARFVIEAEANTFERWRLAPGDVVEITGTGTGAGSGDGRTHNGRTGDGRTRDARTRNGRTGDGRTGDGRPGDGRTGRQDSHP